MSQSFLMCSPEYFGVHYSINPWMINTIGKVDSRRALQQWRDFISALQRFADIRLMKPQPHVPDMVFTANAGLVLGKKFIPSRFRHKERRDEESYFRDWFEVNGYQMTEWPESVHFEGAGDVLVQPGEDFIWAAQGFRTDPRAHEFLVRDFGIRVLSLRLLDPRFYHLDTCFCPLLDGKVMYFAKAFSAESLRLIEENTAPENRIQVSESDALHFACNAVRVKKNIIMNRATAELTRKLEDSGYTVYFSPVDEFMKAGGANKCLTLDLDSILENKKTGPKMNDQKLEVGSKT